MEKKMKREQILGKLFEIFILKLVLMSGYKPIDIADIDQNRIRCNRRRFIEFKGRGEFHQIDVPVDLIYNPNFTYPIRLLGEVKCYSKPIQKYLIREEIGKMKDIQENYFVDGKLTLDMRRKRRMEIFAFFSASGFSEESERLAYAHGIKTISYKNNYCIEELIDYIKPLAFKIAKFDNNLQKRVLDDIYDSMILGKDLYNDDMKCLKSLPFVKTSIIGTTTTGLIIHFLSFDDFPDNLFREKDYAYCQYHGSNNGNVWEMTIKNSDSKFYFSMPEIILKESFVKDGNTIFPNKEQEFEIISFMREIDGKQRNLEFRFDSDWFRHLTNHHNDK